MSNPYAWGNSGWEFITYVILNYPDNPTLQDKSHYYNFLTELQYILPCFTCRDNMSSHLELRPLTIKDLESRESLMKWRIDLQNMVNKHLGKKVYSYEEAFKEIKKLDRRSRKLDKAQKKEKAKKALKDSKESKKSVKSVKSKSKKPKQNEKTLTGNINDIFNLNLLS